MPKETPKWMESIKSAIVEAAFKTHRGTIETGTNEDRHRDRAIFAILADQEDGVTDIAIGPTNVIAGCIASYLMENTDIMVKIQEIMSHAIMEKQLIEMLDGDKTNITKIGSGIYMVEPKDGDDKPDDTIN